MGSPYRDDPRFTALLRRIGLEESGRLSTTRKLAAIWSAGLVLSVSLLLLPAMAAAQNDPPITDAGPDQTVYLGDSVTLHGTATDPDGHPIVGWQWEVISAPAGSRYDLSSPNSRDPNLTTDKTGEYVMTLIASDGLAWSDPDAVLVIFRFPIWHIGFLVCAYLSAALCIYKAFREKWPDVVLEVIVFALFVAGYWGLESWATHAGNFYLYPEPILDSIPYLPGAEHWVKAGWQGNWVEGCPDLDHSKGISLSVLLMEASLTYALLWTARCLARNCLLLWPFLVGLAALCVDLFLDPVASRSVDCRDETQTIAQGLGLWEWRVVKDNYLIQPLGIGWFGIPLFNYAAWFCAPIALTAAALLLRWGRQCLGWRLGEQDMARPNPIHLVLLLVIFGALLALFILSPIGSREIPSQVYVMTGVLIASIVMASWFRRAYVFTNPPLWEVILPQVFFYLFAWLGLFFGPDQNVLGILFAAMAFTVLGMWYCFCPYSRD